MTAISTHSAQAENIVRKYMLGALAVGLVPFPLVDVAALAGIQLKMLHGLARLYGVEFSSQIGKSAISALAGGGIPVSVSVNLSSLAKSIPLFGSVVGGIGTAICGGASTYAVGKVFIQHFESGNTFLTFDPDKVKAYYAQQLEQGKEEVRKNFAGIKP